jgi:hypothetical protein
LCEPCTGTGYREGLIEKVRFFFLGFEPGLEEKEVCAQARRKISEQGVL